MNYASIRTCDIANGEGVRVSLFVSGCTHHCKGCFNAEAQAFDYGEPFTREVEDRILAALEPEHIAGLSLLGGEPMEPANQRALVPFLRRIESFRVGIGSNRVGIGSDRVEIGADRVGIGSDRVGIGSNRVGIGSNRVGIGSNRVGIGSDRVGIGSNRVGIGSDAQTQTDESTTAQSDERTTLFVPKKTLWVYTGCVLEELKDPDSRWHTEVTDEFLSMIDVLVDGPFVEELKDISLQFRGSSNQRILRLK